MFLRDIQAKSGMVGNYAYSQKLCQVVVFLSKFRLFKNKLSLLSGIRLICTYSLKPVILKPHLSVSAATPSLMSPDHTCAFGREPSMCYSGCPADCRNINSTVVAGECDICASGCFCLSGLVQLDSQLCVLSEQCSIYDGMYGNALYSK